MQVSVEVPVESILKGSEAKLLLHLLRHTDGVETSSEMMRGSGVTDRQTFYAAKAKLRDLGLLENPGRFLQPSRVSPVGNPDQLELPTDGKSQPVGNADQQEKPTPRITAALTGEVVHEERSLRERARDVDLAADEAGQVDVLLAAWHELFPRDSYANRVNVKKLLVLAGNSAEDLLDQLEQVKARNIARPFGYIQATLQRMAVAKPAPGVRTVEIGRPAREEPQDYMLSEPSPRTKMIHDRLVAAGLLRRDEDED